MFNFPDTLAPGRVDILIFPNGGKEVIGRQPSYPALSEAAYLPEVQTFVASKQGLEKPEKATGYYTCKGDVVSMTWTPYAGPISKEEQEALELEPTEDAEVSE